jgi:hypothetical protein
MYIGWILIGDKNTPSSRIMGINVSNWMNQNGIISDILISPYNIDLYDIIIFQKIFTEINRAKECQEKGKEVIYILDDLYFEGIPMAQIADKVVCGSEYIREWIQSYTKAKLYTINDAYETPRNLYKKEHREDNLIISWFGTLLHFPQAETIRPLIESLGFKYITISACKEATKQWRLDTIWSDLIDSDIIVIPFLGELPPFELAKGNNRLTQSMILGLPVITSPIPAYTEIIRQGKNGFVCLNNSKNEWTMYLEILKNRDLRIKIGQQAREDVLDKYSIDTIGHKWEEILNDKK